MCEKLLIDDFDSVQITANPKDAVIIYRQIAGKTKRDASIESMQTHGMVVWLRLVVGLIRFYQQRISKRLGNRCVFDPSCSHYAELAFRKKGFVRGVLLTMNRLCRCRPENGGVDELT